MCGICGRIDNRGVERAYIQQMLNALQHRGPDDAGYYLNHNVALGNRRLSIIDLDGGRQPIGNEDGSITIVFNGEIYNYRELRATIDEGHHFATDSDTEVIVHLYEEHGPDCVKMLRGMFAFALWDSRRQTLFMARDHLGQKPLFYVHQGHTIAFASEIKALTAADPTLREMDGEALHQYLTLRIIAPPRTMLRRVRKLPPGHTLTYHNGQIRLQRYWHLTYQPKHRGTEQELLEELDRRIRETVRYHMVSDVPVGAFLSGGLDSSIIVAMMSQLAQQPVKTFSVGVPYQQYSELPYARQVAQTWDTEHYEETITPSLVRILPELVWHLDEPSDPLSASMYYIARMARRHVKVVLGGDGGDELFAGYDRYFGNQYVAYYALLPEPVRRHVIGALLQRLPDGFWYKSLSHKLKWLNRLSFSRGGKRYAQSLSYFYFGDNVRQALYGPKLADTLNGFDPESAIYAPFECDNAQELLDKMLYADSMVRLPDHSVMIVDRTTMAHGLEARSPFMDHKLTEFVARLPTNLKIHGRRLRYIQTRIAQRYLPAEIAQRKKQGFSSPLPYLLDDEFNLLFRAFLHADSHLVRDGYLNHQPITDLLEEHLARRVDHGNRLWLLCNAEIWYRMVIECWPREKINEQLSAHQR